MQRLQLITQKGTRFIFDIKTCVPLCPATYMICPPKTVQCGPEKHGAINNREAQKICGAPESAGPLALAQSAPPPLIRHCL